MPSSCATHSIIRIVDNFAYPQPNSKLDISVDNFAYQIIKEGQTSIIAQAIDIPHTRVTGSPFQVTTVSGAFKGSLEELKETETRIAYGNCTCSSAWSCSILSFYNFV